jgi:hypothetical protein
MRRVNSIKDVPYFPVIPLVPATLLIASLALAISAFARVRRLERQMAQAD